MDRFFPASKCNTWTNKRPAEVKVQAAKQRILRRNFQDDWCSTDAGVDSCTPWLSLSEAPSDSSASVTGGSGQPVCVRLNSQLQNPLDMLFTDQVKVPGDGTTDTRNFHPGSRKTHFHTMSILPAGLFNPLKKKRRLLYLKTQFVPRSKHFSSRL